MSESPAFAALAASPAFSAALFELEESAARVSNSPSWGDVNEVTFTPEAPVVPVTLTPEVSDDGKGAFTKPAPKRRGASSATVPVSDAIVTEIVSRFETILRERFGITLADFKKIYEHLKVKLGNRVWNKTEVIRNILLRSDAGKIVWVINKAHTDKDGAEKNPDSVVFAETYRINGKSLERDIALDLFALIVNGVLGDLVLTDFLPNTKSVKEVIRGYLDTHESENSGCKFEIIEGSNPYILAVKVVSPVTTITIHNDDGKVVKTTVTPIKGPINTKPSAPSSYAGKTGGGAGGPTPAKGTHFPVLSSAAVAAPAAPAAPTSHFVAAPAAAAGVTFDAARLARILGYLAPLVGKSSQELAEMHADGMIPSAALKLLA